jgi:hypothetical protein
VPNTGSGGNFLGPAVAIAGMVTLGLGIALNMTLRKAKVPIKKRK